eukprot:scaffold6201_cov179-Ochromonas_danica.AAC.1
MLAAHWSKVGVIRVLHGCPNVAQRSTMVLGNFWGDMESLGPLLGTRSLYLYDYSAMSQNDFVQSSVMGLICGLGPPT